MNQATLIDINNLWFSYRDSIVLREVYLQVAANDFVGIVGPSGGGKTTLLKLILGLLKPSQGSISLLGRNPREARKSVGYVPQHVAFRKDFPISVEETVLQGRLGKTKASGGYNQIDRNVALRALEEVQMLHLRQRSIGELSGGELQRVLVARALACEPEILILDEPTAHIDLKVEEDIFDLLKKLNQRATIIVVSHDVGFITQYVSFVACLNKRLVCHPTSEITGEIIKEIYGHGVHMIDHKVHCSGGK